MPTVRTAAGADPGGSRRTSSATPRPEPCVGADAFRGFLGPFSKILTRSGLIAAFGGTDSAVLIYDTDTVSVQNAPAAEYLTIRDGQIVRMKIIFDRAPSPHGWDHPIGCCPRP